MQKLNIAYVGLKSTYKEAGEFLDGKVLNLHDVLGGFQRGLIVVRGIGGVDIKDAYSTAGFFLNQDGETGDILFEREGITWAEEEVRIKLRKGKVIDDVVDLNRNGLVVPERQSVEAYFLYNFPDAFPRLKAARGKSIARTTRYYIELMRQIPNPTKD